MTDFIEVIDQTTQETVFYGRISSMTSAVSGNGQISNTIQCEGRLAYLLDSLQVFRIANHTILYDFLADLINTHNAQVEDYKKFTLGTVNVTETDELYRGISTNSTMENIKDKLTSRLGGYLIEHGNIIDYVTDVGSLQPTPIQLGKNVIDAQREYSPENLFTRVYPFGAEIQSENDKNNQFGNPRIDISTVNGGLKYLDNQELIEMYGVIEKSVIFDDVTDKTILKTKGLKELETEKMQTIGWTINAVDLGLIDISFERINLGDKYPVLISVLGQEENLQVIGKVIDITAPHKSTLTFGKSKMTLSKIKSEGLGFSSDLEVLRKSTQNAKSEAAQANAKIEDVSKAVDEINTKTSNYEDEFSKINEKTSGYDHDLSQINGSLSQVEQTVQDTQKDLNGLTDDSKSNFSKVNATLDDLQKQINELKKR